MKHGVDCDCKTKISCEDAEEAQIKRERKSAPVINVGECCEVMKLALERKQANGLGFDVATSLDFKTGALGEVLVYNFRKAKKGDDGTYGHGKKYANSTFAPLVFCPFCGSKNTTKKPGVTP